MDKSRHTEICRQERSGGLPAWKKSRGMEKFVVVGMFVGIAIILAIFCKEQMQDLLTAMFTSLTNKANTNLF